jgi:hypothetical protein
MQYESNTNTTKHETIPTPDLKQSSVGFEYKIFNLYKYLAEGDSITLSEGKAGLRPSMKDYQVYKASPHYERVRTMYAKPLVTSRK